MATPGSAIGSTNASASARAEAMSTVPTFVLSLRTIKLPWFETDNAEIAERRGHGQPADRRPARPFEQPHLHYGGHRHELQVVVQRIAVDDVEPGNVDQAGVDEQAL